MSARTPFARVRTQSGPGTNSRKHLECYKFDQRCAMLCLCLFKLSKVGHKWCLLGEHILITCCFSRFSFGVDDNLLFTLYDLPEL